MIAVTSQLDDIARIDEAVLSVRGSSWLPR
jgi:hypothetical protein